MLLGLVALALIALGILGTIAFSRTSSSNTTLLSNGTFIVNGESFNLPISNGPTGPTGPTGTAGGQGYTGVEGPTGPSGNTSTIESGSWLSTQFCGGNLTSVNNTLHYWIVNENIVTIAWPMVNCTYVGQPNLDMVFSDIPSSILPVCGSRYSVFFYTPQENLGRGTGYVWIQSSSTNISFDKEGFTGWSNSTTMFASIITFSKYCV